MKPNCKNCPNRTIEPNCHLTCKDYLNFEKENEKRRIKERESRTSSYPMSNNRGQR